MKPLNKNELISKFWNGETSLDEEAILKGGLYNNDTPEKAYFDYLKSTSADVSLLEDEIWNKLQGQQKVRKISAKWWTVAATFLVLVCGSAVVGHRYRQAKLQQQFDLLEQALNHVSGELTTTHSTDVLYQDDYIVIVADN